MIGEQLLPGPTAAKQLWLQIGRTLGLIAGGWRGRVLELAECEILDLERLSRNYDRGLFGSERVGLD